MKISGKLQGETKITLPGEWFGNIDPESMVVQLTPYGVAQDLYVKSIDYGYYVEVRSQSGTAINCFYTIEVQPKQ
jgi:hypothetical protein|tara:strand:- start:46 stop:270 length:225 start_codon:yes stop_codon:yes gene_type:complete